MVTGRLRAGVLVALTLALAPGVAAQTLAAAVLPSGRSVTVGATATAYASVINTGSVAATGCRISPVTQVAAAFSYQTTNSATNAPTGSPNTSANIPAGGTQSFVFSFTPTAAFAPTDISLSFICTNTSAATVISGVNTLLLSASASAVPDVIATAATTSNDGVAHIPSASGTGFFATAAVNIGAAETLTVTPAVLGGAQVNAFVCETNPATGACLAPLAASVASTFAPNVARTFSVFLAGQGSLVAPDFAARRVKLEFRDAGGAVRGATSVAVCTVGAAGCEIPSNFQRIASASVSAPLASINREALSVTDVNGDGKLDILMANEESAAQPVAPTDSKTSIFLNDGNQKFVLADTSNTRPTGWVNDWLVLPSSNGNPYIVGIDHGRELAHDPIYWSKLEIFRLQGGAVVDLTDVPSTNSIGFYHNASSFGDLNKDGMADFVSAKMDTTSFGIFYGHTTEIIRDVTAPALGAPYNNFGSPESVGATGAALVIDIGADSQDDFILLPYSVHPQHEGVLADVFRFEGGQFKSKSTINARTGLDFVLPDEWGYSFASVADLNGDGLKDFVGLAESPQYGYTGQRGFVSFIQQSNGSFVVSKAFPDEPIITDSKQAVQTFNGSTFVWSDNKFQLIDVDGDGKLDLFWPSWFNGHVSDLPNSLFFGDGAGHFSRDPARASQVFRDITWDGTARTHMTDVNNDGMGDLLVLQQTFPGGISEITPIIYVNKIPHS